MSSRTLSSSGVPKQVLNHFFVIEKEEKKREKNVFFLLLISLISYAIGIAATTRLFYSLREGKQKRRESDMVDDIFVCEKFETRESILPTFYE